MKELRSFLKTKLDEAILADDPAQVIGITEAILACTRYDVVIGQIRMRYELPTSDTDPE